MLPSSSTDIDPGASAAERVSHYTGLSNRLHRQYLDDPALAARYDRFIDWQVAYMLPFYDDLRERPGYSAAVDFVVSDLTGSAISTRDRDLARVLPVMVRVLPARALEALAIAMQLNAEALEINLAICQALGDTDAITEREYCTTARSVCDLQDCLRLVTLTRRSGDSLQAIVGIPMIQGTLAAMRLPARITGFGALQSFLERGYRIFTALDDPVAFLDEVELRMRAVMTHIFSAPLDTLAIVPASGSAARKL